jgi:hypothetical protein
MNEGWAGWVEEPPELPAGKFARSVAEVALPQSRAERQQAEGEARAGRDSPAADSDAAVAFMARVNGTSPRSSPLAQAVAEPFRDREALDDRRRAIEALKPLGLAHVIVGGQSGCVLDANMGILEPLQDERARAAMDRQYEFERSARAADERNRIVARSRVQLEERLRARGLTRREPHRAGPDDAAKRQYQRACEEIGVTPVSYR